MNRKLLGVFFSLLAVGAFTACGGEDSIGGDSQARLSTSPSGSVTFPTIAMGSQNKQTIQLENTGTETLQIRSLNINENDGDGRKEFRKGDQWFNSTTIPANETKTISIVYKPINQNAGQGQLVVDSNALNTENGKTRLSLEAPALKPQLFSPQQLTFGRVPAGQSSWQLTEIRNAGQAPLEIEDIILDHDNFRLTYPDPEAEEQTPENDLEQMPKSTLEPQESFQARVWFEPDSTDPETADMFVYSNDPNKSEYKVDISGNSDSACIKVSFGDKVDFGQSSIGQPTKKTGTIQNCSETKELQVSNIELTKDDGGVFEIAQDSLPGNLPNSPLTIPTGERVNFVITFTPQANQSYSGELLINNSSPANSDLRLPVEGTGTDNQCPKAEAAGSLGGGRPSTDITTVPLKTVQLSANDSRDPDGSIQRYEWSLIQKPEGSTTRLTPSNTAENPELYLDLQGTYKVELKVFDNQGQASCGDRAVVTIKAIPQDDIHVQLIWDTPADPDETNRCGADLDLHYLHPNGQWKHPKWDIYYKNKTSDWGQPGSEDDPRLDIDDTDGAGPENVNHSSPESGINYRVGVYYFRAEAPDAGFGRIVGGGSCPDNEPDHYGASYATVRIFIDGELQFEKKNKYMADTGYFWEVGVIQWPSGNITPLNQTSQGYPNAAQN